MPALHHEETHEYQIPHSRPCSAGPRHARDVSRPSACPEHRHQGATPEVRDVGGGQLPLDAGGPALCQTGRDRLWWAYPRDRLPRWPTVQRQPGRRVRTAQEWQRRLHIPFEHHPELDRSAFLSILVAVDSAQQRSAVLVDGRPGAGNLARFGQGGRRAAGRLQLHRLQAADEQQGAGHQTRRPQGPDAAYSGAQVVPVHLQGARRQSRVHELRRALRRAAAGSGRRPRESNQPDLRHKISRNPEAHDDLELFGGLDRHPEQQPPVAGPEPEGEGNPHRRRARGCDMAPQGSG